MIRLVFFSFTCVLRYLVSLLCHDFWTSLEAVQTKVFSKQHIHEHLSLANLEIKINQVFFSFSNFLLLQPPVNSLGIKS